MELIDNPFDSIESASTSSSVNIVDRQAAVALAPPSTTISLVRRIVAIATRSCHQPNTYQLDFMWMYMNKFVDEQLIPRELTLAELMY